MSIQSWCFRLVQRKLALLAQVEIGSCDAFAIASVATHRLRLKATTRNLTFTVSFSSRFVASFLKGRGRLHLVVSRPLLIWRATFQVTFDNRLSNAHFLSVPPCVCLLLVPLARRSIPDVAGWALVESLDVFGGLQVSRTRLRS